MGVNMKPLKDRLLIVWENFLEWGEDTDQLEGIKERLNEWLNDWQADDAFGTEGQCDPRGDCRNLPTSFDI